MLLYVDSNFFSLPLQWSLLLGFFDRLNQELNLEGSLVSVVDH